MYVNILVMNNNNLRGGVNGLQGVMGLTQPKPILNKPKNDNKQQPKDPRVVNYCADRTGCAHYRIIWPNYVLNSAKNYVTSNLMKPVLDERWFDGLDVVRLQRQVSSNQFKYYEGLRGICDKYNIRLVYELDDIPLYEDIPLYNKNRKNYARSEYRDNIISMMDMSDEVTVSTNFMKEYFKTKISNKNITHIPNYIPRFWMDRYYNEDSLKVNFNKHKKKPRILYAGSASHYASGSKVEDDFTKLVDYVKKTLKDYQWVFFGGMPTDLIPLWRSGKIEFHNYVPVANYSDKFRDIKANITIAPLVKNNFNRAKSHIKLTEAAAYGIPCICQSDIEPYSESIYNFDSASELDDQIKLLTKDSATYMKACRKSRNIVEQHWLEDNIDVLDEFHRYSFGDSRRKLLNNINL